MRIPDPDYERGRLIKLTSAGRRIADEVFGLTTHAFGPLGAAIAKCDKRTREQGGQFLDSILAELNGSESEETARPRRGPRTVGNSCIFDRSMAVRGGRNWFIEFHLSKTWREG